MRTRVLLIVLLWSATALAAHRTRQRHLEAVVSTFPRTRLYHKSGVVQVRPGNPHDAIAVARELIAVANATKRPAAALFPAHREERDIARIADLRIQLKKRRGEPVMPALETARVAFTVTHGGYGESVAMIARPGEHDIRTILKRHGDRSDHVMAGENDKRLELLIGREPPP
jgi:hypothetical protein